MCVVLMSQVLLWTGSSGARINWKYHPVLKKGFIVKSKNNIPVGNPIVCYKQIPTNYLKIKQLCGQKHYYSSY